LQPGAVRRKLHCGQLPDEIKSPNLRESQAGEMFLRMEDDTVSNPVNVGLLSTNRSVSGADERAHLVEWFVQGEAPNEE
jgi:hypothetical protein